MFDEDLGSWDADYRLTKELYNRGILTMDEAMSVLRTDDGRYKRSTESANKKLSETLIAKVYDGIAYQNTFETKKATTSYIAFSAEQVKSIDNQNPTDNPDIRYSVGAKTDKAVQAMLETENQKLQEDVAKLKDLLKLQGVETGGTKFLESSVLAAARYLKKNSGTSGNTKELAKMLNDFYEYIATSKDLTWEAVREQALPIANWIMDNVEHQRSAYAQEILDQIKGSKVYLDETQMKEAEHLFGSYNDFRKSVQGAMVISKSANMSLDVWWQEMSTLYPDVSDVETTASDMPRQLGDIISCLRNENSSALEYAYSG